MKRSVFQKDYYQRRILVKQVSGHKMVFKQSEPGDNTYRKVKKLQQTLSPN
jgi:hypothetical protein